MNKYDVTLTAHYEKTVSVYADTPEQGNIILVHCILLAFIF